MSSPTSPGTRTPLVSIVVLNYNGRIWLERCFDSLRKQTIVDRLEVLMVDNKSTDDSVALATKAFEGFPCARVVQNPDNLGFCRGNNAGAEAATGDFILFLNNDTWLEPDCMEKLMAEVERTGASAATPLVMNYNDDVFQDIGFFGFDILGLPSGSEPVESTREIFIAGGCSLLINRELFFRIGMFEPEFFIYSEDSDLSWRTWIAGGKIIAAIPSRLHHRGAAGVNPAGGVETLEFRTTDRKRFLTNRNTFLMLCKDAQHVLLLLAPLQLLYLAFECFVAALLLRRISYFKAAYLDVLKDCWRLRKHIMAQRRKVAGFRKRSDFWMLRFFRLRLNRWFEVKRLFQFGMPKIDAK